MHFAHRDCCSAAQAGCEARAAALAFNLNGCETALKIYDHYSVTTKILVYSIKVIFLNTGVHRFNYK
jgi:hypothetical protein